MDLTQLLNEAAQGKDWVVLVGALLAILIPAVLKILGKQVPIVDQILDFAIKFLIAFRKKPEVPAKPDEKTGLAAVVPIEDLKIDKQDK